MYMAYIRMQVHTWSHMHFSFLSRLLNFHVWPELNTPKLPCHFVVKNWLYLAILIKLSLLSELVGNSLDKWFENDGVALIREVVAFEHYEVQCLKCAKHLIFYSYVVWVGRTLFHEMWFGKYFVWNATRLTMENFKMKKLMLNCLWKSFTNINFRS